MDRLMAELDSRWGEIFTALVQGRDVPPTQRLRTEGMMETAALLGIASADEVVLAMDARYRAVYGRAIAEDFGEDWREFHSFPQIPAMGKRAPVFPSTTD